MRLQDFVEVQRFERFNRRSSVPDGMGPNQLKEKVSGSQIPLRGDVFFSSCCGLPSLFLP